MPERVITFGQAINEAQMQEMKRDSSVILLGENISSNYRDATKGLLEEFGKERVRDAPITETAFIGAGVGAAITGLRPVVELMLVDFGLVAMDQILNQMAKSTYMSGGAVKVPMTLRCITGAGVAAGATHSESLHGLFAHMPGMKVVIPCTPYDAKGLLVSCIQSNSPSVYLEHRLLMGLKGNVPKGSYSIPLGMANVCREGVDVTVVTCGLMVHEALKAAEQLAGKVDVEVIDPRTLVPFDEAAILKSLKKTGRLVVVDEDYHFCGWSGEVAAIAAEKAFKNLKAPVQRVATPNIPLPFNPNLERQLLPDADKIKIAIRMIV